MVREIFYYLLPKEANKSATASQNIMHRPRIEAEVFHLSGSLAWRGYIWIINITLLSSSIDGVIQKTTNKYLIKRSKYSNNRRNKTDCVVWIRIKLVHNSHSYIFRIACMMAAKCLNSWIRHFNLIHNGFT